MKNEQVIHVKANDEIATIRERLQWAEAPRVILVVSRKNKALRNKMNLKLVHRTAIDQSIELALVAHHRDTIRLAREIGLPVFPFVRWGALMRHWDGLAAPTLVPGDEEDELKIITPATPRAGKMYRVLSAIVLICLLLLVGLGVLLLVPTAQVTIAPISVPVVVTVEMTANPSAKSINPLLGQIPARVEEIALDGSEQITPQAKKDVPDARATGLVVFTNKSDQALSLPKGSIVSTSAGEPVRFQTAQPIELAPRARAEVNIVAVDAGPTSNVAKFTINTVEGPFALAVNVVNPNDIRGGTVKRVPVVSDQDKRNLESNLVKRLRQEAISKFKASLKDQEWVVPESVAVSLDNTTFDKFVDEPAERLTLTAHATARGSIIDDADANKVALRRLESKLRPGFELLTIQFTRGEVLAVEPDGVRFETQASGQAAPVIDQNFIANSVRGMSPQQAAEWVEQQLSLRRAPRVELKPDWLGRLPWLSFRIQVDVVP